ncbi:fimbrial protein [Serratia nevei]|uniref:fimbrial protein n=1 Tax=Serratia nevei TaxID=2703794 RepID=UPI00313D47B4
MKPFILPVICLSLWSQGALAAEEIAMQFRGGLIAPPPCVINAGTRIDVDFGSRVGIKKVDGENYRQTIDYQLDCEPGALPWEVRLKLKGNPMAFDSAAVQSNKADLGIRIYQNGNPFVLNSDILIDPANPPRLEAVPVSRAGATLTEGVFYATATLQADFF